MPELTLYELETGLTDLVEQLTVAETEEERETLAIRVSEYLTAAEEKRDRFAQFLHYLQGLEVAASMEEQRIQLRRERIEKTRKGLEEYALRAMAATGTKRLEGATVTLKAVANPDKVEIEDELLIPLAYMRTPSPPPPPRPVPDKAEIKKALKAGQEVAGAVLKSSKRLVIE